MKLRMTLLVCATVSLGLAGCTRDLIPNTDVEDTPENREVVDFVEEYRHAVTGRDIDQLMSLASKDYYDDMGTPAGDDDVDFESLGIRLEATFSETLHAVHYDIRYRDIVFLPKKVLVDFTYIGRFQIETEAGLVWERRLSDNRLVVAREGDNYRILSGM